MCDSQHEERDWHFYVQDMLEFCERVLDYTAGLDQDSFVANRLPYDATLRNIQLIGEAATHIPAEVQENYPAIPWRSIIGVRNRLTHAYLHISDMVIWSIIQDAVPSLLPELRRLLDSAE
jgi:uncharacterized protein with HEPN domain